MGHRRKRQPGPQQHAEGMHGERTHRRFIEQLHEGSSERTATEAGSVEGDDRAQGEREQHDEAEKNSRS